MEVDAELMTRSARGIELTAAGRVFLDHAGLAPTRVEAAGEAARRAAHPAKASFVMGFLTGTEMDWFAEAVGLLRDELPSIEVILVSQTSPELASGLLRGKVDVAFLDRGRRHVACLRVEFSIPIVLSRLLAGQAPTISQALSLKDGRTRRARVEAVRHVGRTSRVDGLNGH
jgi:DNA-binding transcriptional LysR family regulator